MAVSLQQCVAYPEPFARSTNEIAAWANSLLGTEPPTMPLHRYTRIAAIDVTTALGGLIYDAVVVMDIEKVQVQ